MKRSMLKISAILILLITPLIASAACFDDLAPEEENKARPHIDEAVKHGAELTQGGRKISVLSQEASKTKGLQDLKKKISEIEINAKKMLEHAAETINAINGAIGAPDITKESKGHGEEALSNIKEATTNLRQTLNSTNAATSAPDFNKAMENTKEGIRYAERARYLADEGYFHIKKM